MRAHSDEEIIAKASGMEKKQEEIKGDTLDIAVDLDDLEGARHTYVVTYVRAGQNADWLVSEVTELSAW